MRLKLSLKTLLRSPLRTLLTMLLLAAAAFACVSRVSEAFITYRELERASDEYVAVGWLSRMVSGDGYIETVPVPGEILDKLGRSEHVEMVNKVRAAAGTTGGYKPDAQQAETYDSMYFVATVVGKTYVQGHTREELKVFFTMMPDDQLLAGHPVYIKNSRGEINPRFSLNITMPGEYTPGAERNDDRFYRGELYPIPDELMELFASVEQGTRYLFKATAHSTYWAGVAETFLKLQPLDGMDTMLYRLDGELDLSSPEFDEVRKNIELVDINARNFTVLAADDMSMLPMIVSDTTLEAGRYLTADDEGQEVCVVSAIYADANDLSVGDTLNMTIQNVHNENYSGTAIHHDDLQNERAEKSLEIVGIFNWSRQTDSSFFVPTAPVYVPQSALPDHWTRDVYYDAYNSFLLTRPEVEQQFLADIDTDGFTVSMIDSGWERVGGTFADMRRASTQNAAMMVSAGVAAILLVVFLFTARKRNDYAIMRALGVSKSRAGGTLHAAFAAMAIVSVAGGGVGAYYVAQDAIVRSFADVSTMMPEGFTFNLVLPVWFVVAVSAATLLAAIVALFLGTILLGRPSPLALLQGGIARRRSRKIVETEFAFAGMRVTEPVPTPRATAVGQVTRYIARHMRRSAVKTLVAVLVAWLFIFSLGMIQSIVDSNRRTIDNLYDTTEVSGYLAMRDNSNYRDMGVPVFGVTQVLNTGYVKSTYYEAPGQMEFGYRELDAELVNGAREAYERGESVDYELNIGYSVMFNAGKRSYINRFFEGYARSDMVAISDLDRYVALRDTTATIDYLDGHDNTVFGGDALLCVITSDIAQAHNLMVGDALVGSLLGRGASYAGDNQWGTMSSSSLYKDWMVVGIVDCADLENTVFIPAEIVYENTYDVRYDVAEFTLDTALNRDLDPFRERVNYIFEQAVSPGLKAIIFRLKDEELTQVVEGLEQNTKVLENMFPIVLSVAILISAALPGLIIMQSSKDASLLRVLGTSKRRTRAVLAAEQIALCAVGLLLGVLTLYLVADIALLWQTILLCAAGYLGGAIIGTLVSAIVVTRRDVLELLQTKE